MAGQYFSESEIDEILGAVEETMQNAANLAKSVGIPQEEDAAPEDAPAMAGGQVDSAPEETAVAPTEGMGQEAVAPEAAAPEAGAEEAAAMPAEESAMPAEGAPEQGVEGEQGMEGEEALEGDNGQFSDEELHQIYAEMDPAELERHYMIIRSMLRDAYAKMEKSEGSSKNNNSEGEDMAKNAELEKQVAELTKSNSEMQKSLEAAVKAMQIIAKPERKAVTSEVQVLGKTESDVATGTTEGTVDYSSLSKSEINEKLNEKVRDPKLSKSDRDAINGWFLRGEGQEQIFKILGSK